MIYDAIVFGSFTFAPSFYSVLQYSSKIIYLVNSRLHNETKLSQID